MSDVTPMRYKPLSLRPGGLAPPGRGKARCPHGLTDTWNTPPEGAPTLGARNRMHCREGGPRAYRFLSFGFMTSSSAYPRSVNPSTSATMHRPGARIHHSSPIWNAPAVDA